MSFFQKVISTVNQTVNQLTMPTVRGYEVEKKEISIGGVQGQWKIHNAYKGDKNKNLASAFILSKQGISDDVLSVLRKEATSLAKLRHPAILSLQEPLQDEKGVLAFVTERVECSLQTALQRPELFQQHCSSDIEMQMHLLELAEALVFLHNDVRTAHLDINPNNIYITAGGKWKLGGLAFSQQVVNKHELVEATNFTQKTKPSLNFSAPELLNLTPTCNYCSDIFSFGMLILRLMKQRKDKISFPEFSSIDDYKQYVMRLPQELPKYTSIYPSVIINFLIRMLDQNPQMRPSIVDFQNLDWFKDPLLQVFNILNRITELEQSQQINFLKGLQSVIFNYEPALLTKRVLPTLLEFTRYDYMIPMVLRIMLDTMKRDDILDSQAYAQKFWPKIKQITQGKEIPAQALYDLVSNFQLFHKYIAIEELQNTLMPLMVKCFECKIPKLQDIAIRVTPYIVQQSDYTFTKQKILPRIITLCTDQAVEVRRVALVCLYKMIDVIDRQFLCDQLLQALEKVKHLGTDRTINQIILKIYQNVSKNLPVELIATKILPQITPFLIDTQLSKGEFEDYMLTLKNLLDKIAEERYKNFDPSVSTNNPPVDLSLDLPDTSKKQTQSQTNQFEFLQSFNLFSKTQEQPQPQPVPTTAQTIVNTDPFGFGALTQTTNHNMQQNNNGFSNFGFDFNSGQTAQQQPNLTTFSQTSQKPNQQQQQSVSNFTFQSQTVQPQTVQPQIIQQQSAQLYQPPIVQQTPQQPSQPSFNQTTTQQFSVDPFSSFNNPVVQTKPQSDPWGEPKKLSQRPLFNNNQQATGQSPLQSTLNSQQPPKPKQVNLNYDPFADIAPQNTQEIWKQPVLQSAHSNNSANNNPQARKYDAFDLI